jgi:hypothetical protein
MPEGAVYVGRPTRWGSRWCVNEPLGRSLRWNAALVVELFRWDVEGTSPDRLAQWLAPLRDATALVCWCPLDQPCHADVLIELLTGAQQS